MLVAITSGDAIGFWKRPCICAPATASAAPTSAATTTRGRRIATRITRSGSASGPDHGALKAPARRRSTRPRRNRDRADAHRRDGDDDERRSEHEEHDSERQPAQRGAHRVFSKASRAAASCSTASTMCCETARNRRVSISTMWPLRAAVVCADAGARQEAARGPPPARRAGSRRRARRDSTRAPARRSASGTSRPHGPPPR